MIIIGPTNESLDHSCTFRETNPEQTVEFQNGRQQTFKSLSIFTRTPSADSAEDFLQLLARDVMLLLEILCLLNISRSILRTKIGTDKTERTNIEE